MAETIMTDDTSMTMPDTAAPSSPGARRTLASALRNGSVRIGGGVLLALILMAIFAPWLGTIDPNAIDPASGNMLPLSAGEFTSLAGDTFHHFFLMGSD